MVYYSGSSCRGVCLLLPVCSREGFIGGGLVTLLLAPLLLRVLHFVIMGYAYNPVAFPPDIQPFPGVSRDQLLLLLVVSPCHIHH